MALNAILSLLLGRCYIYLKIITVRNDGLESEHEGDKFTTLEKVKNSLLMFYPTFFKAFIIYDKNNNVVWSKGLFDT